MHLKGTELRYVFASASSGPDGSLSNSEWVSAGKAKSMEPKTVEFSSQHKVVIAAMTARLETLAQEARAVEAEKQSIQQEFQLLLDRDCRAVGGGVRYDDPTDGCKVDLVKGTFTVPSKPSEEAKK